VSPKKDYIGIERNPLHEDPRLRPSLIEGRTDFTYYPGATRIPEPSAVNTKNASHTITAT
jgi:arylsulfatase